MKEILSRQGHIILVDDEDFERINQHQWLTHIRKNNKYYVCRFVCSNNKTTMILLHREIMGISKGFKIDHRDGNPLNNCKSNLRMATHQQNMRNRKDCHRNNKLGVKGVCFDKRSRKFRAKIQLDGKNIHLGLFNVIGDADSAYRKAEEQHFGEYARCNN